MDLETTVYVSVGVLGAGWLVLALVAVSLCLKVRSLNNKFTDLLQTNKLRVQKLKMERDKNFAYQNPSLVPDEELAKRGYSMYVGNDDVESARGTERQTGGQLVAELTKQIDARNQRQTAPPFLLQAIEENKRNSRNLSNPVAAGGRSRASDTNPNFIY